MYQRHFLIAVAAIVLSLAVGLAQQTADTILYNGKILTVDPDFSTAQAVAVRGNRILGVGTNDEVLRLAGPNTLRIDLKGKTMIPGFINTHVHLEAFGGGGYARELGALGTREFVVNVRGLTTADEVLQQMRDIIAAFKFPPGEWIYFKPNWTGNQADIIFNGLNAKVLDRAAPNNPIVVDVGMQNQNINLLNGVALKEVWRKYGPFVEKYGRYWIDAAGEPSGILEPPASRIVWEDQEFALYPKPEVAAPYFRKILVENYSSMGITTISGSLNTTTKNAYVWLDERGEMPLRYGYGAMAAFHPGADLDDFKLGAGTDHVFITSMSARANDGGGVRMCISMTRNDDAVTAGGLQANSGDMNRVAAAWWPRGQCNMDIEYNGGLTGARISGNWFGEWYNQLAQEGLRSANAHVSGERSVTMMIDSWDRIDRSKPGSVKGWAFDHCNLVNPQDIPRAARLGLYFSCNPGNAIASNVERGARSPLVAFGPEVLHNYGAPFGSMLKAGINVSLEVEGGRAGWWNGLETMITRIDYQGEVWGGHERIDRRSALKVATINGAKYVLKEDQLGSIETGKFADLVVLDRDYMTIPVLEISEIRPLVTMVGGKFVFLRTDFSDEYNLKPAGAEISTYEELQARREGSE